MSFQTSEHRAYHRTDTCNQDILVLKVRSREADFGYSVLNISDMTVGHSGPAISSNKRGNLNTLEIFPLLREYLNAEPIVKTTIVLL